MGELCPNLNYGYCIFGIRSNFTIPDNTGPASECLWHPPVLGDNEGSVTTPSLSLVSRNVVTITIKSSNPLNIGYCCNNKITRAYRVNPLTRHVRSLFSGGVRWGLVNHHLISAWPQIQSCYGLAREFWLIVFTNSIWLDSPSLSLSGLMVRDSQGLVSPRCAHHQARAHTMQPLTPSTVIILTDKLES